MDQKDEWTHCLTYTKPIDFTTHTYITAGGPASEERRRAVFIHGIKFYDNEEVIEGEDELLSTEEAQEQFNDFSKLSLDLLAEGNVDGYLLTNELEGIRAYNDKLLKYNSKYAQLIGKQKSNVDGISQVVASMPHLALIDQIRRDIHELDMKQQSFAVHFDELSRLIGQVTNDYLSMKQTGGGVIVDEALNKEMSQIQLSLDQHYNSFE